MTNLSPSKRISKQSNPDSAHACAIGRGIAIRAALLASLLSHNFRKNRNSKKDTSL
jgi:hypothetical protein